MRRSLLLLTLFILIGTPYIFVGQNTNAEENAAISHQNTIAIPDKDPALLYNSLRLDELGLSEQAFQMALEGYLRLQEAGKLKNESVLTIADMSLPSSQKRFFVVDLKSGSLLFHTYVTHGRNSGKLNATSFSNKMNSFQSCPGFFVTANTYQGKHGLSLRLQGMEKDINDMAWKRGIVVHGADYANGSVALQQGYLGRSLGCPALPPHLHEDVIKTIQNGSCFFIYTSSENYLYNSTLL